MTDYKICDKDNYLFISYAHADKSRITDLLSFLTENGVRFWIDDGIDPGTEWDEIIASHIDRCAGFMVLISENSQQSFYCKKERSYAINIKHKEHLSIFLEDATLSPADQMLLLTQQSLYRHKYAGQENLFYERLLDAPIIKLCTYEQDKIDMGASASQIDKNGRTTKTSFKDMPSLEEMQRITTDAENGDARAQYWMGNFYCDKESIIQNPEEGFKYYEKSAEQGFANAQYMLGECYYKGIGTKPDVEKALYWYSKSAKQGYESAVTMSTILQTPQDQLTSEITQFVCSQEKISISMLQRHFLIGYARATRIIESLEERGIIDKDNGTMYRNVLVKVPNTSADSDNK